MRPGIPLQDEIQTRKGLAESMAGVYRKADDEPTEEGVTKLPPTTLYQRDKKLNRWRYAKGVRTFIGNKPLGGQFVKAPPGAGRKMGMKGPVTKK